MPYSMHVASSIPAAPVASPCKLIKLNDPADADLKRVNYMVGVGGGGYSGPPLYIANIYVDQTTMDTFIAFYNAHPTTTTVTVSNDGAVWSMTWSTP
jgi:hypothetical protein